MGEGNRSEDTWVFRRAELRKFKEEQSSIFKAVKLGEGQYEQRMVPGHSGARSPRKLGASESRDRRCKRRFDQHFRARHGGTGEKA